MVNYDFLNKSVDYYKKLGYNRIETPWWVPEDIQKITAPKEFHDKFYKVSHTDSVLVASGEQSFLYLIKNNHLPPGKYQTITPCFRNEKETKFNSRHFIKNELIITDNPDRAKAYDLRNQAFAFFLTIVPEQSLLSVVSTKEGWDIEYNGIELGSYGMRSCEFVDWVYGTGCAEPRLSLAIESKEE